MQYVNSDKQNNYYVDFDKSILSVVNKVSRLAESVKIKFNADNISFRPSKPVSSETLILCLPMYQQYLLNKDKRILAKDLWKSISHDLNDDAARDFNSFS